MGETDRVCGRESGGGEAVKRSDPGRGRRECERERVRE